MDMLSSELTTSLQSWRERRERIVLVTGVFDLLHLEHVRFLSKARALGDTLVVGIETDERVKRIKGKNRPIHPLAIRLEQVEALKSVDHAFALPQQFDEQAAWLHLLASIKPEVYAASSNSQYLENKRALCRKAQVDFVVITADKPTISSSDLEAKLLQLE